jgi:hypothetical protein
MLTFGFSKLSKFGHFIFARLRETDRKQLHTSFKRLHTQLHTLLLAPWPGQAENSKNPSGTW